MRVTLEGVCGWPADSPFPFTHPLSLFIQVPSQQTINFLGRPKATAVTELCRWWWPLIPRLSVIMPLDLERGKRYVMPEDVVCGLNALSQMKGLTVNLEGI
jgi:hypothetical protein